jgi:hypothetical protein
MQTERVALRHYAAAGGAVNSIALRELRGRDELAVDGVDTRAALALLDRLIGRDGPGAASLCAADRDALLAGLHRRLWGDRILTTLRCRECGERFDLSFTLSDVQAHLESTRRPAHISPPTGEQELRAAREGARAGVAALARELGVHEPDIEEAAAGFEAAAPILDLEITAHCAECQAPQEAHFDLQSFLLQRLLGERESLLAEVHLIAASYGWSLREIVSMPRATRRTLVGMLEYQRSRMR